MASTKSSSVKIVEVCKVAQPNLSPESATELSLPLTFFDSTWLNFPPSQCLFFYKFTESITSAFFHSEILPKLKRSLSHTLFHFPPLAGRLTWPPHSTRPIILYSPNDAVSLTVAETNADIDRHMGNQVRDVSESRPYVPELPISETTSPTMALQITVRPGKGFTVGITTHHAVFDGKSAYMFLKAWSYICKHSDENGNSFPLSQELIPLFDRTIIKDPARLESMYLNQWMDSNRKYSESSNPRSLEVLRFFFDVPPNDLVRSAFKLSSESLGKIRESVLLYHQQQQAAGLNTLKKLRLSAFVLTCSYTLVCMVKAKGEASGKKVIFVFAVDCRSRSSINPPIPQNYFGNSVCLHDLSAEAEDFAGENGVAIIAERLSDYVNGLDKLLFEEAKERIERMSVVGPEVLKFGIAGSTKLAFYNVDFGWGKPEMVEIPSIDHDNAFSLMEGRDGKGEVEIALALPRQEMEVFKSLFAQGINAVQPGLF
ncbi:hypothetical protein P3X46_016334 [Hevea brasiliensis]|uniref:Uncharacterized protein n=1 Tax=Hevea brasiliensis TaxID=3981 RepID=A0ABQ9M2D2_HEVBR|nr:phenolic glucoside malonyltransferase 1 [Hevea brasiliensis]KAJ9173170.1 hypothetical protein P3X46_016334 [Hevea brasiliensis]